MGASEQHDPAVVLANELIQELNEQEPWKIVEVKNSSSELRC